MGVCPCSARSWKWSGEFIDKVRVAIWCDVDPCAKLAGREEVFGEPDAVFAARRRDSVR